MSYFSNFVEYVICHPIEFDKDDESAGHIDFMHATAVSRLLSSHYSPLTQRIRYHSYLLRSTPFSLSSPLLIIFPSHVSLTDSLFWH